MIEYLKTGRDNAITRQELSMATGMSDRAVRMDIARLREKGIAVISTSDSTGYYLAENIGEVRHYIAETRSIAMKLLNTANKVQIGYFNRNQIEMGETR